MEEDKIIHSILTKACQEKADALSEFEAKKLLGAIGIPTCREKLVNLYADQELCVAAKEIGYPLVLKACGRKITHKTERGLVYLNIPSQDTLLKAAKEIREKVSQDEAEGLLVQEMLMARRELMFGYLRDELFGSCVVFGLGGILAEVLDDVTFRLTPLKEEEAQAMLGDFRARKMLGFFRGEEPANRTALSQILLNLSKLENIAEINSVDLNPVVISKGRPIVVDALVTLNSGKVPLAFNKKDDDPIGLPVPKELWPHLFQPQKIAIVGFSQNITRPGHLIWKSTREIGFRGKIYLVNPNIKTYEGYPVYPSINDIPEPVETFFICVAAPMVAQVIKEAGARGARWLIVITSGFSELGTKEGRELEKEIFNTARLQGIRLIGPNCMGIYCPKGGLAFFPQQRPVPGAVSFFSQSGSIASFYEVGMQDLNIPIAKLISLGNALDIGPEEILTYLKDDPDTKIITGYLEGAKKPRNLLNVLREIKKPVIIYKAGRSKSGERAVISHTGALAGTPRLWDGLFKQTGVISVDSVEELNEATAAFYYFKDKHLSGNKVAIITGQGGAGVSAADACDEFGFALAVLNEETQQKLQKVIPVAGTSIKNPVDLGFNSIVKEIFQQAIINIAHDQGVDLLLVVGGAPTFLGRQPFLFEEFAAWVGEIAPQIEKPIAACLVVSSLTQEAYQILYQHKIPVFGTVQRAIRALSHWYNYLSRR
ncbi:MAG: acetate--CoA ligase family protein [Peptococcaceae bacterium]